MNEPPDNVHYMDKPHRKTSANGGNGNGSRLAVVESRLTTVEARLEKVDTRLAAVESRLAAVETRLDFVATKEDIQTLHTTIEQAKNSMLRWGVGIFVTATGSLLAALGGVLFMAFRLIGD